jgi:hypothetical protein
VYFILKPTLGPFPGVKRGQGVTLTTYSHIMQRSRMNRSYISSPPWSLYGVATALLFTSAFLRLWAVSGFCEQGCEWSGFTKGKQFTG